MPKVRNWVARSPLLKKGGVHERAQSGSRALARRALDDAIDDWYEEQEMMESTADEVTGSESSNPSGSGESVKAGSSAHDQVALKRTWLCHGYLEWNLRLESGQTRRFAHERNHCDSSKSLSDIRNRKNLSTWRPCSDKWRRRVHNRDRRRTGRYSWTSGYRDNRI